MATNHSDDDDRAMASLFRLRTADISDRLKAMLETERRPHYRPRDYLHQQQQPQRSHRRQDRHGSSPPPPLPPLQRSSSSRSRSRSSKSRRHRHHDDTSSAMCPASRAKIVQWLYDCVDYLELSRECVALAMSYVDRFMSLSSSDSRVSSDGHREIIIAGALRDATLYQLVAVAALFLAAKQSDNTLPADLAADALVGLSRDSYSGEDIVDAEAVLLDALGWRLCDVTAAAVARHAVALLSKAVERRPRRERQDDRRRLSSVLDFSTLQIELAVADYPSAVLRRPSAVALAAVLNSVELLDFTERERRRFGRALRGVDGGDGGLDTRSEEMGATRRELHRVFDRRSRAVAARPAASRAATPSRGGSARRQKSHSPARSGASPVDVMECIAAAGRKRRTKKKKKKQR